VDAQTPSAIFASNLRQRREELGWSQEDVAGACRTWGLEGVTRATIAQIETGRRRVSLDEAVVLSYLLQTPIVAPPLDPLRDALRRQGVSRKHLLGELWKRPKSLLSTEAEEVRIGARDDAPAWVLDVPTPGQDPSIALILSRAGEAERLLRNMPADEEELERAASRLWGHGILEERDRLLAEARRSGDARVRRGLLLRQLILEVAAATAALRSSEDAVAGMAKTAAAARQGVDQALSELARTRGSEVHEVVDDIGKGTGIGKVVRILDIPEEEPAGHITAEGSPVEIRSADARRQPRT
jgi:transcriptional regulator with XRE-family HTH domain